MSMYMESINTPLGITSKLIQDDKRCLMLQTPISSICSFNDESCYITLNPTKTLVSWMRNLYVSHA